MRTDPKSHVFYNRFSNAIVIVLVLLLSHHTFYSGGIVQKSKYVLFCLVINAELFREVNIQKTDKKDYQGFYRSIYHGDALYRF
jgi:hypothetical protein